MNRKYKIAMSMFFAFGFVFSCSSFIPLVSEKPIHIEGRHVATRAMLPQPTVKISGLKAVLIGGPIDGKNGSLTRREIKNLRLAKNQLKHNGVKVFEFYSPRNQWTKIKKAARGAHFLLYRGHGVYDGSRPPRWVGGFSLQGRFVSSKQIKSELKLAPGAIVMLYGCFTAGNSGFDMGKINQTEAIRRVSMYAKPFMESKFSAYYANWYGDAFAYYIAYLFSGETLGGAFKSYKDFNSDTAHLLPYSRKTNDVIWIDHDNWKSGKVYNNAFVGTPTLTLKQLFSKKK